MAEATADVTAQAPDENLRARAIVDFTCVDVGAT
jgi:hypothetical protein